MITKQTLFSLLLLGSISINTLAEENINNLPAVRKTKKGEFVITNQTLQQIKDEHAKKQPKYIEQKILRQLGDGYDVKRVWQPIETKDFDNYRTLTFL
jgi:hypothetical protein